MSERPRERKGRHVSVGGEAAEEVLDTLVKQFADRNAFIRELIQNSLDANAARIDVRMCFDGHELRVEVQDDGDGMDRAIIEGYLLTLFRSTKEEDLTKIGKFGIGFTSIFAMEPFEVIVDTGRDGVWHRVTFDEARAYTLSRLADPYEGTTVTLRMARNRRDATADARAIRAAAERWCRYADATITTAAEGTDDEWDALPVSARFEVDAPVTVRVESDGFTAVLGPHPAGTPPVGFYNRGITLLEAHDGLLPGVTFRAAGRHLEHTLTRDNVIRDRHFEAVIERLWAAARGPLAQAVHAEAAAAARDGDVARAGRLFACVAPEVAWAWREDAPVLPGARGPVSLNDLRGRRSLLERLRGDAPIVWWARPGCPIAAAVTDAAVVLAEDEDGAHLAWAARVVGGTPRAVTSAWHHVTAMEGPTPVPGIAWARLSGTVAGRLAVAVSALPATGPGTPSGRGRDVLAVDPEHPLVRALDGTPDAARAALLQHAARVEAGLPSDARGVADRVAGALTDAAGGGALGEPRGDGAARGGASRGKGPRAGARP